MPKYRKASGTDQIAEWKAAIGRHRKQQRRARWKRKPQPVTGIRIPAPSDSQERPR